MAKVTSTMYAYDWKYEDRKNEGGYLRVYGIDVDRQNVCLRVVRFKRWIYAELPSKTAAPTIKRLALDAGAVDVELVDKTRLYYHDPDKKSPFLKCWFTCARDMGKFTGKLYNPIFIAGVGKTKIKLHEDHANPVLQLASVRDLKLAGWIKFTGKPVSDDARLTECAEYVVSYKNLEYLENQPPPIDPKSMSFDLEVNSENVNCMPSNKPGDKIFQISCVFRSGGDKRRVLLSTRTCGAIDGVKVVSFETEKDLIAGFIELLKSESPNVVCGYNILSFDIPYLIKRCARYYLGEDLKLAGFNRKDCALEKTESWSSSAFKNQHFEFIDWEGILILDLLPIAQRDYKLSNYRLNTVASVFLDAEKDPVTPKDIFAAYRDGDVTVVGKYCVKDSELVSDLMHHWQLWVGFSEMAKVCYVPMFYLYTKGQQIKIYSQVYKYCYDRDILVDTDGYVCDSSERYRGAYVLEPKPGYYEDVCPLDFSSLYPSIMQAWNICFSTAVKDKRVPDELCNVFHWEDHVGCEHDPKVIKSKAIKNEIEAALERQREIRRLRDTLGIAKFYAEALEKLKSGDVEAYVADVLTYEINVTARRALYAAKTRTMKQIESGYPAVSAAIAEWASTGFDKDATTQIEALSKLLEREREMKRDMSEMTIASFISSATRTVTREATATKAAITKTARLVARRRLEKLKRGYNDEIARIAAEVKPLRDERDEALKGVTDKVMCCERYYRFYKPSVRKGVIPEILTHLLSSRAAARKAIKTTNDPIEKIVLDKRQLSYKVSANSMYGALGVQRGMLAYMPGAMCVTFKGREALIEVGQLLTTKYDAEIVYGDTDSQYCRFPAIPKGEEGGPGGAYGALWQHCIDVAAEISKTFPPPMNLAFEETIYKKFLILSKKRYMWQSCGPDGVLSPKVGKKGVLLARRDNSKFIRDTYETLSSMIFDEAPRGDVFDYLSTRLNNLFCKTLDVDEYVITKAVGDVSGEVDAETGKLGDYKVRALHDDATKRAAQLKNKTEREYYVSCAPAQVQLAERMKKRGTPVDAGSRLEFVVIEQLGATTLGDKLEELDYYKARSHLLTIDALYYVKTLKTPLDQLLATAKFEPGLMTTLESYRRDKRKVVDQLKAAFAPKIQKALPSIIDDTLVL